MKTREIEMVGFDADGQPVSGYAVETNKRWVRWTPRDIKKMLARDGAVTFRKRIVIREVTE